MGSLGATLNGIRHLETLSHQPSVIHSLDARVKVVVALAFIGAVVSLDRYQVAALIPFVLYPALLIIQADLPIILLAKKIALVLPVALLLGIANPLLDRNPLIMIGPLEISAGWVSYGAIVLRTILTVAAALVLLTTTGFVPLCDGLRRLGVPHGFVMQLQFLYRYLFVLGDEGQRMKQARDMRSWGNRGRGITSYGALIATLLIRTWERSQRLYQAMLARGFDGKIRSSTGRRITSREYAFAAGWISYFLVMRIVPIPHLVGEMILHVWQ